MLPKARVKYLPMMTLKAMSVSMALQHQWSGRCSWSLLPPGAILMFKDCADLASTFASCSTLERRTCTSPRKHYKAGLGCRNSWCVSPEVLSMRELALPIVCSVVTQARQRCPPPTIPLTTYVKQESGPHGIESRKAGPAPQLL